MEVHSVDNSGCQVQKYFLPIFATLALAFSACIPASGAPTPSQSSAPTQAAPVQVAPPTTPVPPGATTRTDSARDKVSFMLSFRANGPYSPFYLAQEKGYFAEQGIDAEIIEGTGSAQAAKIIGAGSSNMGMSDGAVLISSVAEGIPIKAVAGVVQTSPMAVIVKKASGMKEPKDLVGKKFSGTAGAATEVLLDSWLKLNKVDPTKVQMVSVPSATKLTTLLDGQVDGVLNFYYDSVPILRDKGLDVIPIRYADFGLNVPGLSIIANTTFMKEKPDVVRRFVAASMKGFAEAKRDPKTSVAAIVNRAASLNAKVEAEGLAGMLELLHSKRSENRPLGWMAPEDWEESVSVLAEPAALKRKPKVDEVMTNDFVASQ